jgi:hypothetical protein
VLLEPGSKLPVIEERLAFDQLLPLHDHGFETAERCLFDLGMSPPDLNRKDAEAVGRSVEK